MTILVSNFEITREDLFIKKRIVFTKIAYLNPN